MPNVEDVYRELLHIHHELLEITTIGIIGQATEAKQDVQIANQTTIIGHIDGLEALLTAIDNSLDVNLSTRASEAKLEEVRVLIAAMKAQTDKLTFNGANDLQVTLGGETVAIDKTGLATDTKQDSIIAELVAIKGHVDGLEAQLTSIDGKVATEAKQDTMITNQGAAGTTAPFGSGILGWLRGIWDRLNQFQFTGGALDVNATITPSPIQFVKDTVDTEVNLDTVTAANNEPLPVCLYDEKGKKGTGANPFGIAQYDNQTGSRAIVDLNGAVKFGESIILCGDVLYGQALSSFLWQNLSINGGVTVGGDGEQLLQTGTTANGEVILQSRKKSRFMISQFNIAHFGLQLNSTVLSDPNTIVEWGCVTWLDDAGALNATPNGIFIRVKGHATDPEWEIVSIKNGVETANLRVDWNGVSKDLFNPAPNLSVYEIQYNAGTAFFFQGSNFIHRVIRPTTYAATYNFPVAIRIRNINGNTTNHSIGSRAAGTYRLGEERGELISRALTASTLLKTGAGYVGKASLSRTGGGGGNSGIAIIYDGINNGGIPIGRIDVSTDDVKGVTLDGTFSEGLYVDIIGAGTNTLTINFE